MRWSSLLVVALLSACGAAEVQSQHRGDGSWSFVCSLPMDDCVRYAQEKCPSQRFRITEGISEVRLRDAPPYEHAYHTSRLQITCTSDGAEPLFSFGGGAKAPAVAATSAAPAAPPLPVICSVGQTRECVGAGACKGGQACLASGHGYGDCDCGPVTLPSASPSPVPAPSGEVLTPPSP